MKSFAKIGIALLCAGTLSLAAAPRNNPSFSMGAVDGLGRKLPQVPVKKQKKRAVAIFYWTWHYSFGERLEPRNVQDFLAKAPQAKNDFNHPVWQGTPHGTPFFWGKPLFGYYVNTDPYVVRKHASMLALAGVDAVVFDCTNGAYTWMPAVKVLLEVFHHAAQSGIAVPKIAFMLNFAPTPNAKLELRELYREIYQKKLHPHLWFQWDGKPLIMAHPEALDPKDPTDAKILDFFTFRRNEPTYFHKDTSKKDERWGWCSVYPQARYGVKGSSTEQMTVSVAQNATVRGLSAMNDQGDVFGRGFAKGDYTAVFPLAKGGSARMTTAHPDAWLWGINFQQQWDRALEYDPDLVFVTGWNEWIAGRHQEWCGTTNAFPDQFNQEFSRDIEPSADAPYDHFYYQLAANIRRYKGGTRLPARIPFRRWNGENLAAWWRTVNPVFSDFENDTPARNSAGWQGVSFQTPAQNNDILLCKAAYDTRNLYFYVQTSRDITPPDGKTWMRLWLDAGLDGWQGFSYVTEFSGNTMTLFRFASDDYNKKTALGAVQFFRQEKSLMVILPRNLIGLAGKPLPSMEFKWTDGQQNPDDILEFYTHGDAAPDGRFRYLFRP